MRKYRKSFFFIAMSFVVLGLVMVAQGVSMLLDEYWLDARGAQTTGEIESYFTESHISAFRLEQVEQTWIIVGYWVDNVWYGNRFKLMPGQEDAFERGQLVTVVYDSENPSNGRPLGFSGRRPGWIQSIFAYLMIVFGVQTLLVLIFKPRPRLINRDQPAVSS